MNQSGLIFSFVVTYGLLMIAMTVHEFSHGWVAYKFGDTTAKYSGRLTLNPLAHIDTFWTVLLPLFLFISSGGRFMFGTAKPVPVNFWALKNPRRDMVLVGAAGPLSNFIFALGLSFIIRIPGLPEILEFILTNLILINLVLGVFNLIPIPPLDGSRILMGLLPRRLASQYAMIEPFGFIILVVLIFLGAFGNLVWPIVELMLRLLGISKT